MSIVLKNIKVNLSFSEETTMFNADVFYNNKKIAYAKNDGRGGCTDYMPYEGCREVVKQVESVFGGSLEDKIDDLLENHLQEKENKKNEKLMENYIHLKLNSSLNVKQIGFKTVKLAVVSTNPALKLQFQSLINAVKEEVAKGYIIQNTNISHDLFV